MNMRESFINNGFKYLEFNTIEEAKNYLYDNIKDTTISFGGSMTLKEMNMYDLLSVNNTVYSHWVNPNEINKASNIYMLSANAITTDGQIVNIDGVANRISNSLYGHKKVIYIVGKNKIENSLDLAINRAKNIAAPLNAKRLNKNTPCVKVMKCVNCNSSERICKALVITSRPTGNMEVEVIVINENLGY